MENLDPQDITKQNEPYRAANAPKGSGRKNRKLVTIAVILLVLLVACGTIFTVIKMNNKTEGPIITADGDLPIVGGDVQKGIFTEGMTEEQIKAALQAVADKDNFQLQIVPEMYFKSGDAKGSIIIVNPRSNVYPIAVEIALKDGTVIYKSGLIKPEEYVEGGRLLKKLNKGVYEARGTVTIYSENGKEVQGVTSVDMQLTIES